MQLVRRCEEVAENSGNDKVSVIVWLPDSDESSEYAANLLRTLREAGLRVFAASFPDLDEVNLFVGNSVYSGDGLEECLQELTNNRT